MANTLKQHFVKFKKDNREEHHAITAIETGAGRVPGYRYHHVEIRKNILTPNTPNLFTPHLRDLDPGQETKYHEWLRDIESKDGQTGFKPMHREEKYAKTLQIERTRTIALFVDSWLDTLGILGCTKSDLISYMARQDPTDTMTPKQRTDILNSQGKDHGPSSRVNDMAVLFTDAFSQVFENSVPESKKISLRDVLLLDESVDSIMDTKPIAKEGNDAASVAGTDEEDVDDASQADSEQASVDNSLGTYTILGCLICFSHGCDHGEYKADNDRQAFSLCSGLRTVRKTLNRRRKLALENPVPIESCNTTSACRRHCYRKAPQQNGHTEAPSFSKEDEEVLQAVTATTNYTKLTTDPICLVANLLEKDCQAVYLHAKSLGINLTRGSKPVSSTKAKVLPWYDRNKKQLLGDWQEHIKTDPKVRQLIEPCFHAGPCAPDICSCVDAGLLCDRFCGCTAESCSYKYTGCPCRSLGKTCLQRQHEKPTCICILMNRECDPELCGPCGAMERADPAKTNDEQLHSTGCQNVAMQRGASKSLLLGQSQLYPIMFGLFTAQDIAQDDFVVEYVGEMISQDEGTRRESRRSDVFSQISSPSYLFTLLEDEGIWVDAAIYGNLSRYINHRTATQEGLRCNITPRVLYVNGEFRIKFVAMRDIKAGEELFFDYGDEFPNLNSLMESATGNKTGTGKRRRGRLPRSNTDQDDAGPRAKGRPRFADAVATNAGRNNTSESDWNGPRNQAKGRKRKRRAKDSDEDAVPGKRQKTNWPDSGLESPLSDLPTPERLQRLRRRHMLSGGSQSSQLSLEPPKPRGKRGGARPGSGRPRKHPRPVPKSSPVVPPPQRAPSIDEAVMQPLATREPEPQPETPTKRMIEPREREDDEDEIDEADEVGDSEDGDDFNIDDEDEDEEEEDDEEDEEDEDVVVRKNRDRHRRPPAKFREDIGPWN